jgi:hypothetical protein
LYFINYYLINFSVMMIMFLKKRYTVQRNRRVGGATMLRFCCPMLFRRGDVLFVFSILFITNTRLIDLFFYLVLVSVVASYKINKRTYYSLVSPLVFLSSSSSLSLIVSYLVTKLNLGRIQRKRLK